MSKQPTIFQLLMKHPPKRAPNPEPAPAPAQQPSKPRDRRAVDAMKLSPEDLRRHYQNLGLTPPDVAPPPYRPMGANAIESQRAADESRRAVDRAERGIERERARAAEDRAAQLQVGSIDARTATPEQVRARYAELGLDATAASVYVRDVGAPLNHKGEATHAAQSQRDRDREVARHVQEAIQKGQSVDTKKLSAGEFAALMELRGAGGWTPAR